MSSEFIAPKKITHIAALLAVSQQPSPAQLQQLSRATYQKHQIIQTQLAEQGIPQKPTQIELKDNDIISFSITWDGNTHTININPEDLSEGQNQTLRGYYNTLDGYGISLVFIPIIDGRLSISASESVTLNRDFHKNVRIDSKVYAVYGVVFAPRGSQ